MPAAPAPSAEAAIWARVLHPEADELPRAAARALLRLTCSARDTERMNELAEKNRAGRLTAAERRDLEGYVEVGDVLSLIHLKARRSLRP
jgi:hypothetical protein